MVDYIVLLFTSILAYYNNEKKERYGEFGCLYKYFEMGGAFYIDL